MKKYQVNFLHLHVNGASNSKLTKFTLITYVDHQEKYRYILLNNVSSRIKKKFICQSNPWKFKTFW